MHYPTFSISTVNKDSRGNLLPKLAHLATKRPSLGLVASKPKNHIPNVMAMSFRGERLSAHIHGVEHYLAHVSSAFHVSPFEQAIVLSIDGFGAKRMPRTG